MIRVIYRTANNSFFKFHSKFIAYFEFTWIYQLPRWKFIFCLLSFKIIPHSYITLCCISLMHKQFRSDLYTGQLAEWYLRSAYFNLINKKCTTGKHEIPSISLICNINRRWWLQATKLNFWNKKVVKSD